MEWVMFVKDGSQNCVLIGEGNFLHIQAGFTGFANFET